MTITTITPPSVQPVTLAQIKQHLRIDHADDDTYLVELSEAATTYVETYTRHKLINRTLRQYVDEVPQTLQIEILAWPVVEVTEVTGFDTEGAEQIVPSTDYKLSKSSTRAFLQFENIALSLTNLKNGLEIDFVAGHGESGLDIPANITRALLVLIAHWYEFRGAVQAGDEVASIPQGFERVLAPVRLLKL